MPSAKSVWGIEVGQCALKALKLQWRDGKLRALGFDVIEHAKILSQPDADEQALIRSALAKFLSRNSIKGSTVVISVPGQASFTRFIKLPPVEIRKVPEIVRYEARQQIPFNLEDVVWDYQTISPPSAGPREVEVGIFAMKRDIVADYVSDFLAMHIEPDVVQMAPVALYNFLRYDRKEGSGATLLMDVGAENTNLVIADGDRVWIRSIPLGGNNFTQALCKEFKLPFSKAESLKRHAAESKHAKQVFQAMRPVFGDLLTEVQRSIGYYTSLHRDSRVERVVALGNAFRLQGLAKFISQNLGVEVSKVEGFNTLADAEALAAPLFRENVLSFGVAFGLAIQGVGVSVIQTSLLPAEILNAKIMRKKRPFLAVAGAALVGAVACLGYDQMVTSKELEGRPGEVKRLADEVNRLQKDNQTQEGLFAEQKKALLEQRAKIASLESLIDNESYAYEVLRTVWEAWPHDPNWEKYDPVTNTPPRTAMNIIEMLSLTAHYVPDVRAYSEAAGASGMVGADVSVVGAAPAPGAAEGQPGAEGQPATPPRAGLGAEPGILVEIIGITPKTGVDGQKLVNETLMAGLTRCRRTVRLQTPQGEEVLAKIPLTGMFRNQSEYQDFVRQRGPSRPAPPVRGPAGAPVAAVPEVPQVDKGNDFWFKAQWVVQIGPLRDDQRREVYRELCRLSAKAGLDSAAKAVAPPKDLDAEKAKELERETTALLKAWLITRDDLAAIAAEGMTKEWPKEEVPGAPR